MKKLLIVYSFVALILFGVGVCGMLQSCSEPNYKEVDGRKVQIIENNSLEMDYVEFDGHEYVRYYNGYRGSMCHSPKCHCLTGYKK
jgi:hypothetical protein